MEKTIEIPEGYEARIEGNKVILELKESEDEKIRKEIIEFINWANSRGSVRNDWLQKKRPSEWIAYLEKQKEQKPAAWSDSVAKEMFIKALERAVEQTKKGYELTDCDKHSWWEDFKAYSGIKPAEWSEKYIANIFEKVELAKIAREQGNDKLTNALQDAMLELSKGAEWSEEYRKEDLRTRFAFYTYKDEDSVLYLSNVFVEETSRNKGFGTKILQAAEMVAQTIGALTIRLKVKQNTSANDWYRRHGYGYLVFEDGYDWLEKNLEYLKARVERER